jgi:hypothetical protein
MASIIHAAAGTAIGGSVGGSLLGVSAATIGGATGSIAGLRPRRLDFALRGAVDAGRGSL